jgi:hypothetical protein
VGGGREGEKGERGQEEEEDGSGGRREQGEAYFHLYNLMRPTFMHLSENSLCSDALSKLLESNPKVSGGRRKREEEEE